MSLFGRRKPGFSKEVELTELDLSGEFSDRNDPALNRNSNPKEEKAEMAAQAQKVMGGALYEEEKPEAAQGQASVTPAAGQQKPADGKMDLFEYMDTLPEVDDPFPPSEPEKEAEPAPVLKQGEILAEFIRERSRASNLTPYKALLAEDENMETILAEMKSLESCRDIRSVKGSKDEYFYSDEIMANNYAMIAMLVLEKDIAHTIAHMVTFNCKTYPSPTPLYYFMRTPYFYSAEEIKEALKVIEKNEETKTIKKVEAQNGVIYLYDEAVMSFKYARALAMDGEAGEADF